MMSTEREWKPGDPAVLPPVPEDHYPKGAVELDPVLCTRCGEKPPHAPGKEWCWSCNLDAYFADECWHDEGEVCPRCHRERTRPSTV